MSETTNSATSLTTNIQVNACDNELFILAAVDGGPTVELCHISSGFTMPVNYSVNPGAVLKPGSYSLFIIGINWGGPSDFSVVLTTGGEQQTIQGSAAGTGVWVAPVQQITVAFPT
jgi:hypothetical protein